MTNLTHSEAKYAIIGAGPCGLAAAKIFLDYDIPFDGYESGPDVGGLWDINNPDSTVYESAHLISSKFTTGYSCFPMPDSMPDYPSHREVWKYFCQFAQHFGLYSHFSFLTRVVRVQPNDEQAQTWQITLQNGETRSYAGVIIASGTFHTPSMPRFEGNFSGEIVHSAAYKSADLFANKRVLVVGAGNSGCDIAVDAVYRAQSVALSMRRGYHFVPKYVFGKPADTLGGLVRLPRPLKQRIDEWILRLFAGDAQRVGFPKPDHKLYELHPVVNSLVIYHAGHGDIAIKPAISRTDGKCVWFSDGSNDEYDIILAATGYQLNYPFIDPKYLCWRGTYPQLFLHIFNPQYRNLFMLGMVEATGLGWQGRYEQAQLVAAYIRAKTQYPDRAQRFDHAISHDQPKLNGGYQYMSLDRMAFYVHKDTYRQTIKAYLDKLL